MNEAEIRSNATETDGLGAKSSEEEAVSGKIDRSGYISPWQAAACALHFPFGICDALTQVVQLLAL